jgi:hypothetical protein
MHGGQNHLGLFVLSIGEIEREQAATSTHPTQRQALSTQVVLEHPMVSTWLVEEHGPDSGETVHAHWQVVGDELFICGLDELLHLYDIYAID